MAQNSHLKNKPIIDLRAALLYQSGHLAGATNIPFDEIDHCWHELPPKGSELSLCVCESQLISAKQLFARQHYPITEIYIAEQLSPENLVTNPQSQRLWKANPLLEEYITLIKQYLPANALAIDIGCGSGRDSVFLGLQHMKVLALDNNDLALERLSYFSKRWQVDVEPMTLDCEAESQALSTLIKERKPQLIVQSRYLHRPLLPIYRDSLQAQSMIAIHTFFEEAAQFGKPKNPAFLLARNELADCFSGWNIILDEQHYLSDGRPLSMFLAQKP